MLVSSYAQFTQLFRRVLQGHRSIVYLGEVHVRSDRRAELAGPRPPILPPPA